MNRTVFFSFYVNDVDADADADAVDGEDKGVDAVDDVVLNKVSYKYYDYYYFIIIHKVNKYYTAITFHWEL